MRTRPYLGNPASFNRNRGWDMAKRYYWELYNVSLFGEPLKVFSLEVPRETGGQPSTYYELALAIENDPNLTARLRPKMKGPIEIFPRLHLLEHREPGGNGPPVSPGVAPLEQYTFWDAFLFSLYVSDYSGYYGPYKGQVLGIAFDRRKEHGA